MKKDRILNPQLIAAIAKIGHTESLVIGDAGLPIPEGVPTVDLSLVRGIPSFAEVLEAVSSELVVESYIIAEEMEEKNPRLLQKTQELLGGLPQRRVPHEEFKAMMKGAKAVVRTGETTSFANVILIAGVNF